MKSHAQLPLSIRKSLSVGKAATDQVSLAANYLAVLMECIHGGDWSVDIDHDACFVAVCRDFHREARA